MVLASYASRSLERPTSETLMNQRLKVAILYLGRRGGIAHHTVQLARAMQDQCDLTCYFSENCSVREHMESLTCAVRFFPTYHNWSSFLYSTVFGKSIRRITNAIEDQGPDFVIDTGTGPWGDLLYRRRMSRRIIWARIIHDVVVHEDSQQLRVKIHRFFFPPVSDVLMAVSRFSAGQLRARYPARRILASRGGVLHPVMDPDLNRIAANRKNFLFFGRIEKYKGVGVLVAAYALARSVDPELRLVIAGQGEVNPSLRTEAEKLGVTLINNWIPEDKVFDLIAAAGVLVLPYLSATQSGVSGIALANGLPIIATNVGGLPEHVADRRNGRTVPPGDCVALANAMLEVSQSEALARSMAQESLHLGRTLFSWTAIADDLLADLAAIKCEAGLNYRRPVLGRRN